MKKVIFIALLVLSIACMLFHTSLISEKEMMGFISSNQEAILQYDVQNPIRTSSGFIIINAVQALLPTSAIMAIIAGTVWPFLKAVLLVYIGAVLGSHTWFLIIRYLGRDWVEEKMGEKGKELSQQMSDDGIRYLAFVRLIPLFSFSWVTWAAALSRISAFNHLWVTALTIIPGVFAFVGAGSAIGSDASWPTTILIVTSCIGAMIIIKPAYKVYAGYTAENSVS